MIDLMLHDAGAVPLECFSVKGTGFILVFDHHIIVVPYHGPVLEETEASYAEQSLFSALLYDSRIDERVEPLGSLDDRDREIRSDLRGGKPADPPLVSVLRDEICKGVSQIPDTGLDFLGRKIGHPSCLFLQDSGIIVSSDCVGQYGTDHMAITSSG